MTRRITPQTTLDNLKKEAKRWLKELRANEAEARARFERATAKTPGNAVLRDVQHALALEYGLPGWTALKEALEKRGGGAAEDAAKYERLASDMVAAYATGDAEAMQRINEHYGRSSTVDDLRATVWRLIYKVRQAGGAASAFGMAEAQELIARTAGFGNWTALTEAVATGAPPPVPAYAIDAKENRIAPRREPGDREWDAIVGAMKERRITALDACGFMTDEVLKRICELDHVTGLRLGGSRQLIGRGAAAFGARAAVGVSGSERVSGGKLTDRGLEVLRHLPNLRTFQMTWQSRCVGRGRRQSEVLREAGERESDGLADGRRRDRGAAREGRAAAAGYGQAGDGCGPGDAARFSIVPDMATTNGLIF